MSVILRIDVDRAYMKQPQDYLRMDDLDNRGIGASFFFLTSTLPKSNFTDDLLKSGHSIGSHAVQTQDFSRFLRELDKISKRFNGKVCGFTKHGSGESYYRFHAIFKKANKN